MDRMTEEMILQMADNLMDGEINPFTTWDCLKENLNLLNAVHVVWQNHGRTDAINLILKTHLEQCYSLPAAQEDRLN